jgi:hypothetical protein
MTWRRSRSWSASGEHFHYDAAAGEFVIEKPPAHAPEKHSLFASEQAANMTPYLAALAEIRRELSRQPADEWESGHVISLYASVDMLASRRKGIEEAISNAVEVYDTKFGRSLLSLEERVDAELRGYCQTLDSFVSLVVNLAEIVIARRYPAVLSALSTSVNYGDKNREQVSRLNTIVKQLQIPDGANILRTWLSSFDRPSEPSFGGIEEQVLGGSYWRGDVGHHENRKYRQPGLKERLYAATEFVDVCAEIVRDMLRTGGKILHDATLGMLQEVSEKR